MNQLFYLVSEAFRGLKSHRSVVFPTVVTIYLCSALLSVSLYLLRGDVRLFSLQGSFYTVEAFLNDGIDLKERRIIEENLKHEKWLDSVKYVSEAEAYALFKEQFSEEMLTMVGENPLPASFRMRLAKPYRSPQVLFEWINILKNSGYYDVVQAPTAFVETLDVWKFWLFFWPFISVVFLIFTLGLIIGNAVRLALFTRRLLVENMKYTGAGRFFIEFPFVLEGVLQGIAGSLCASLSVSLIARALGMKFELAKLTLGGVFLPVFLTVFIVTFIAGVASLRSVRAFLTDDRGADA